jgi:hypothetical protein
MVVKAENPAPYTAPSAVLDFVTRYRNRGLSTPFTGEVLARAGVSDSLIPRTLQALVTLDLITAEGMPTETLEGLRRAPETEFKQKLAAWINAVYADVLSFANPTDDEQTIRDAFRAYNPVGQQSRMVTLFIGLCRAAGLRTDEQSQSAPRPAARKPAVGNMQGTVRIGGFKSTGKLQNAPPSGNKQAVVPGLPAPLVALLTKLPAEGGSWTQLERDKFEAAFKALLDFSYDIGDPPADLDPQE